MGQSDLEAQTPNKATSGDSSRSASDIDEKSPGYDVSTLQKCLVVFTTSFATLAACFSSTSLFSAASEIADEFGTAADVINASSAGVLFTMGLSNFIWGPITTVWMLGRLLSRKADERPVVRKADCV